MEHGYELLMPQGAEGCGWAFACRRLGAAHHRAGKPCQDACQVRFETGSGGPCLIGAVADGHGDERHDRSETGAHLAVIEAVEELRTLQRGRAAVGVSSRLVKAFKTDFAPLVCRRWRDRVREDARSCLPHQLGQAPDDRATLTRYGTTLLTALVVGNALLVGQIGDGAVLWSAPPSAPELLLPCANEEVGIVTDSLCSARADHLWRTRWCDCSAGGLVLLATDGLVNAFADDDQLFAFARSLGERIHDFGPDKVALSLPDWLANYSALGSGDDVTLAVLVISPGSQRHEGNRQPEPIPATSGSDRSEETTHATGSQPTGLGGDDQDNVDSDKKTR
jgi:serine/threonine protein phosphatase PrpC